MEVLLFVESNFCGSDIIIMEGTTMKMEFVYNSLQTIYGDKLVMVNIVYELAKQHFPQKEIARENLIEVSTIKKNLIVSCRKYGRVVQSSRELSKHKGRLQGMQK